MSATGKNTSYGNASLREKLGMIASLLFQLPPVLLWALLSSPFHPVNSYLSWKRVLINKACYFFSTRLSYRQVQWASGTTRDVYDGWAKSNKLPIVVDELGEGAQLLWIGERRTDKVLLYLPGGAFLLPMAIFAPNFWKHVHGELKSKHQEVGIAILQYSLIPTATFPTPLKQTVLAIHHLLSTGVHPQNIQLAGESAGANLILQFIAHVLHPIPEVPILNLSAPLRGVYLLSPWVSLTSEIESMTLNEGSDMINAATLLYWGREVLAGVPETQVAYLEPLKAPEAWFDGMDRVVERVLITGGDAECLRDSIVRLAEQIEKQYGKEGAVTFVLQKFAVHNDPFLDFMLPGMTVGELTPLIVEWLAAGFDSMA
ncbi:putative steryl acetyl hydrolase mug81 [Hypsizygus marmoreus]|uniref:Steryl acetyl hydrolase mug81 n=1 Tax=Hypsizygus marmoreus TaxID=39966 RepID=A0A369JA55_HYPMA|nr:putative steryl acetyl hydrolase mug81 [Hypsizygus marmoreus]